MLHVLENVRMTTSGRPRRRGRAPSSRRTGRRPRRRRAARARRRAAARPRRRLDEPGRVVRRAQERDGRPGARSRRARPVEVEREVGAALPLDHRGAGDPGDLGVQLIGRLERRHRPAGTGVRQQQHLQHLVGTVGGEHLLGGDPVQSAIACAARSRRDPGSGASRSRDSSAANASRHAPAADTATRWCSAGPRRRPGRVVALEGPQVVTHRHQVTSVRYRRWRRYWRRCDRWLMSSSADQRDRRRAAAPPSTSIAPLPATGWPTSPSPHPRRPTRRPRRRRSTRPSGRCAAPSARSSGPSSSPAAERPSARRDPAIDRKSGDGPCAGPSL